MKFIPSLLLEWPVKDAPHNDLERLLTVTQCVCFLRCSCAFLSESLFLFNSDLLICCLTVVLTGITSFLLVLFLDAPLPVCLPLFIALIWFRCLAGSGASRLSSWTVCLSVSVAIFAALICLLCALSHR